MLPCVKSKDFSESGDIVMHDSSQKYLTGFQGSISAIYSKSLFCKRDHVFCLFLFFEQQNNFEESQEMVRINVRLS